MAGQPAGAREVFGGRFIRVELLERPEGDYEVVRHPGAAAILPLTPNEDVLLVRQLRPAIAGPLIEIPAGLLDHPGEDALSCAVRELREETGFGHETVEFLGGYFSSAGFTDEYVHLFVATTLPEPEGPPEDGIELLRKPFRELVASARAGRIRDVKTTVSLLLAHARGYGR